MKFKYITVINMLTKAIVDEDLMHNSDCDLCKPRRTGYINPHKRYQIL